MVGAHTNLFDGGEAPERESDRALHSGCCQARGLSALSACGLGVALQPRRRVVHAPPENHVLVQGSLQGYERPLVHGQHGEAGRYEIDPRVARPRTCPRAASAS